MTIAIALEMIRKKDRRDWKAATKVELRDNFEYMKYLLDIEDWEDTATRSSNRDNCDAVVGNATDSPFSMDKTANSEFTLPTAVDGTTSTEFSTVSGAGVIGLVEGV